MRVKLEPDTALLGKICVFISWNNICLNAVILLGFFYSKLIKKIKPKEKIVLFFD